MTALAKNFARKRMGIGPVLALGFAVGLAASTRVYQGSLVAMNQAGNIVPASADASLHVVGVSEEEVDNSSGSAGDLSCTPRRGAFYLVNSSSTDAITDADIGRPCFVVDDNTVARTSNGGARPIAGIVEGVDSFGVAVSVGMPGVALDGVIDLLYPAGADLSTTGQNLFVKLNSSGQIVLADGAGELALGVLQNAPTSGAIARVRVQGVSKVIAGATLADGAAVATTATTARAKAAVVGTVSGSNTTGSYAMGVLLADGASGVATTMLVKPMGLIPHTAA
jgi:hypothetical protein